jgi:hypothetical protein
MKRDLLEAFQPQFLAVLSLATVSACGGGSSAGTASGAGPDGGSGGSGAYPTLGSRGAGAAGHATADVLPPFTKPFAGLISQSVPWGDEEIAILGAALERGMDSTWDPEQVVAELQFSITDNGTSETDYESRNTWDLVLAGGTRLRPLDALGVLISPGDTAKAKLHYKVPVDASLEGAKVILACSDRTKCEPESIPLDSKWEQRYPLSLGSLVGAKAAGPDPGAVNWIELKVMDAFVDLNDPPELGRAPAGERLVRLDIVATHGPDGSIGADAYLGNGLFRIVIDGNSYEPVTFTNDTISANSSKELHVVFTMPASTNNFEILLNAPKGAARFPVDLAKDGTLLPL